MNPPKILAGVSGAPGSEETSLVFMIVLFVAAITVGVAVAYLGIAGVIGGPIP
ncbi:MAG TPA: hypothetical protein VN842_02385 [Thermoplasmata archaeon]|nr:hypothetical protein [Thermoplasmata archaeon]